MPAAQDAARAYVQQRVLTASKEKLVTLLYESTLAELERALKGLRDGNRIARVGESLGKAFSIVSELKTSLDMESGGEIAANLDQLYTFVQGRITLANRDRQEEPILEASQVMRELKEGWDGILGQA